MIFDLRVLVAACLAILFFAAAGLAVLVGLRAPYKSQSGYANEGASIAAALPKGRPIFSPVPTKPEITGTITTPPEAPKQAPPASAPEKSIETLIEDDKAKQGKAKAAAAAKAKAKAAAKKKLHPQAKQPANNPFSVFTSSGATNSTQ